MRGKGSPLRSRLNLPLAALAVATALSCEVPWSAGIRESGVAQLALASGQPLRPDASDWVAAHFNGYHTRLAPFEIEATARALVEAASHPGPDLDLMLAVIRAESRFDAFAVSPAGALGLMQIMPETGREFADRVGVVWRGSGTLFDPVANVKIGSAYLRFLHERYGSWPRALAAYNWGPARIERRLARGHALPQRYASRVIATRAALEAARQVPEG